MEYSRVFIVISPTAIVPKELVRGIASTTHRLDVILRSAIAALSQGNDIRRDTLFIGYASKSNTVVELRGNELKEIPFSEIELLNLVLKRSIRGIQLYSFSLPELKKYLETLCKSTIYLKENGEPIDRVDLRTIPRPICWFLGAHIDVEPQQERILGLNKALRVSLGKISYMTYQCIVIVNRLLDRAFSEV